MKLLRCLTLSYVSMLCVLQASASAESVSLDSQSGQPLQGTKQSRAESGLELQSLVSINMALDAQTSMIGTATRRFESVNRVPLKGLQTQLKRVQAEQGALVKLTTELLISSNSTGEQKQDAEAQLQALEKALAKALRSNRMLLQSARFMRAKITRARVADAATLAHIELFGRVAENAENQGLARIRMFERSVTALQRTNPSIEHRAQLAPLRKQMKSMVAVAKQLLGAVGKVKHEVSLSLSLR